MSGIATIRGHRVTFNTAPYCEGCKVNVVNTQAQCEHVYIDELELEMSFARGPGPAMSSDLIVPAEGEPVPGEWP